MPWQTGLLRSREREAHLPVALVDADIGYSNRDQQCSHNAHALKLEQKRQTPPQL
jgi:hypothetical protein